MRKRMIPLLCALLLCVGLIVPTGADSDVIFISINDNLLTLSSDTMPFWSDGILYVPITTFDSRTTGINLEVYGTYSERSRTVSVYNLNKMLVFDLNDDSCYNYHSGLSYSAKAMVRNGVYFIPVYMVCDFFGLDYNLYHTASGTLLRIKDDAVELSDAVFIDAASMLMSSRLREYNQSLVSVPTTPAVPTPTPSVTPTTPNYTPAYLAVRCSQEGDTAAILWGLETQEAQAIFFLTPDHIAQDGNLVRQLVGSGHTIGILAEGETEEETLLLLAEGNRNLAAAAYTTTTVAMAPRDQWAHLEGDGWLFWDETSALTTQDPEDTARYATAVVRALIQDEDGVLLTLEDTAEMGDCLIDILLQLEGRSFYPSVVTEMIL